MRARLKTSAETGDGSEHVGVFAPLPPELASQFPELDGDSSRPHVTLLYVGPVPNKKDQKVLVEAVREFYSKELGPIEARLSGVDYFRSQTGCVAYCKVVFSKDMGSMKDRLKSYLEDRGVEVKDAHPLAFNPHVTLKYTDDPYYVWKGATPKGSWSFQHVEIWGLDKVYPASIAVGRDLETLWGFSLVRTARVNHPAGTDLFMADAGSNTALSGLREILRDPDFPKALRSEGLRLERSLSEYHKDLLQFSEEARRASLEEDAPKDFRWILMGLNNAAERLGAAANTPGVHPVDRKRYLESRKRAFELLKRVQDFEQKLEDRLSRPLWESSKDLFRGFFSEPAPGIPIFHTRVASQNYVRIAYEGLRLASAVLREVLHTPGFPEGVYPRGKSLLIDLERITKSLTPSGKRAARGNEPYEKNLRQAILAVYAAEENLSRAAKDASPELARSYLRFQRDCSDIRKRLSKFQKEVSKASSSTLWSSAKSWARGLTLPSPTRVASIRRQGGVYQTLSEADDRAREMLARPTPSWLGRELPYVAPPDEACTLSELSYLRSLEPLRKEWGAFVKAADEDIVQLFLVLCSELGVPCGREPLDQLTSEAAVLITKLKWIYNRPRPYQVAGREKIPFSQMSSVSSGTPAYPSGHTIQASLIASRLSEAAPQHRAAFMALAEKISFSRMVGGYHWPSDIIFGKDVFRHVANPGMPATVRVAGSPKEARTYNRIVMYDFDGTLFRSWEIVPDWWKGTPLDTGPWSFFKRPESLGEPCVPDRPGDNYWVSETLSAAQADTRDRNTLAVLVTGRAKVISGRVQELLSQKCLSFDRMFFNPGMPASAFKTRVLGALLAGHPSVDEIEIWENENQDHYAKYLEAASRALDHEVEVQVHNVHEKPAPLKCGPEDFSEKSLKD